MHEGRFSSSSVPDSAFLHFDMWAQCPETLALFLGNTFVFRATTRRMDLAPFFLEENKYFFRSVSTSSPHTCTFFSLVRTVSYNYCCLKGDWEVLNSIFTYLFDVTRRHPLDINIESAKINIMLPRNKYVLLCCFISAFHSAALSGLPFSVEKAEGRFLFLVRVLTMYWCSKHTYHEGHAHLNGQWAGGGQGGNENGTFGGEKVDQSVRVLGPGAGLFHV